MFVAKAVSYIVVATFLVTFSGIALLLGGPASMDSRALFVLVMAGAGLAFSALAFAELRTINARLKSAQA